MKFVLLFINMSTAAEKLKKAKECNIQIVAMRIRDYETNRIFMDVVNWEEEQKKYNNGEI